MKFITSAPAAFAGIARKVNELIYYLNVRLLNMRVETPLSYSISDVNSTLTIDIAALRKLLIGDPNKGPDPSGLGVIGVGSTVAKTLTYEDATIKVTIDADGVKLLHKSSSDYVQMTNAASLVVYDHSSTSSVTIAPAAITRNLTVKEISVCDGGVVKKMLILGSATYT